jgi:hypothetical protein
LLKSGEQIKAPASRPGLLFLSLTVMPGFMPGIHVLLISGIKTWMAGTSPAMTKES